MHTFRRTTERARRDPALLALPRCAARSRLGLSYMIPSPPSSPPHPPLPPPATPLLIPMLKVFSAARRVLDASAAAGAAPPPSVGRAAQLAADTAALYRLLPQAARAGCVLFLFLLLRGAVWWGGGEGWGWGWGWDRGWHGGTAVVCCTRGRGTCPMGSWSVAFRIVAASGMERRWERGRRVPPWPTRRRLPV